MRYDKPVLATVGQAKGIVLGYPERNALLDSFFGNPEADVPESQIGSRDGTLPPDDQQV